MKENKVQESKSIICVSSVAGLKGSTIMGLCGFPVSAESDCEPRFLMFKSISFRKRLGIQGRSPSDLKKRRAP